MVLCTMDDRQHAVKHSKVSVQVKDIEASGMTVGVPLSVIQTLSQ